MATVTYAIVFKGEIAKGFQPPAVKAHMAQLLKADASTIKALFSGKPVLIKRTPDKSVALKYGAALKNIGATVHIKVIQAKPQNAAATTFGQNTTKKLVPTPRAAAKSAARPAAKPAVAKTAAAKAASVRTARPAAVSTSKGFTLAPNVGNLFDAEPEVATLDLDLSEFSLAENDGTPLIKPKVYKRAKFDLSQLSVAKNDGSRLFDAAPEVKKVKAPDFGLDVPGAILETLSEVVELLDPDTSAISLAVLGSDLLNEDEKQPSQSKRPTGRKISLARE